MSLNIKDLDLASTIRDIVDIVSAGTVYIVRLTDEKINPFDPDAETPLINVITSIPCISFKDATKQSRIEYKEDIGGIYSCRIGLPTVPILPGDFCYLDWGGGTVQTAGVIKSYTVKLSSLVTIEFDSNESVPFDFQDVVNAYNS